MKRMQYGRVEMKECNMKILPHENVQSEKTVTSYGCSSEEYIMKKVQNKDSITWTRCDMKWVLYGRMQHKKSKRKKLQYKKVRHAKGATGEECKRKKVQHEKCSMKKVQHAKSATGKECKKSKRQHEKCSIKKSATGEENKSEKKSWVQHAKGATGEECKTKTLQSVNMQYIKRVQHEKSTRWKN